MNAETTTPSEVDEFPKRTCFWGNSTEGIKLTE